MEAAERIKLKKESAELNMDNIISSEGTISISFSQKLIILRYYLIFLSYLNIVLYSCL